MIVNGYKQEYNTGKIMLLPKVIFMVNVKDALEQRIKDIDARQAKKLQTERNTKIYTTLCCSVVVGLYVVINAYTKREQREDITTYVPGGYVTAHEVVK